MKIAILDLTAQKGELFDGLPRVFDQIKAWISPALPEATYSNHDLAHGEPVPSVKDFDGLIVSGSEYGVYDDTPWMSPLRALLTETQVIGKPIYGICFGHQLMADVFGGKAEKAKAGYHVGVRTFEQNGDSFEAHAWHQDQVTTVPPGASVVGSASHCPVGALAYDFPAMSVQYHPEYRQPHLRELFARGRDIFIAGEKVDEALESFAGSSVAEDLAAVECAQFFRNHLQSG